jgi:hypothetical protein
LPARGTVRRSVRSAFASFVARAVPPESAIALAALRIAVVALLLVTNEPGDAIDAARAHAPVIAPEGLGWFVRVVPLGPTVLGAAAQVYRTAAVLSLFGVYTRPALAVLLASGFLLFSAAQLSGAVLHDMHLLWLLAVLCASGAAHRALSVDAWLAEPAAPLRRRLLGPSGPDPACGVALFFARTLLGLVYFFPGFWKLRTSGLAWALSDNLAHQMHAKWLEFGVAAWPRIDRIPSAMHALGLFTIAFELGFVFVVHAGPAARVALALAGLAFHLGIEHFLFIPFASLWVTYVALLPLSRLARSREPSPGAPPVGDATAGASRVALPVALVGSAIAVAVLVQGVRGRTQAFPFACYPTFAEIAGPTLPDLVVTAIADDGSTRIVPHGRDPDGRRSQREWGTVWSVAGLYGTPYDEGVLRAYLHAEMRRPAVREALAGAREVRPAIVFRPTDPEAWGEPARGGRNLPALAWPAP